MSTTTSVPDVTKDVNPVTINIAPAPFNNSEDSDVILRSKKRSVDFYVFKMFLAFASPIFKTMFTLPQEGAAQEMKDGLPVIQLEEDEETLGLLLKYCYPGWGMASNEGITLEKLINAREAALKYEMDGVASHISNQFVAPRFITDQPLRVYAIALRYGLEREARIAARATLRLPILGRQYFDELEFITAGAHHRLQVYHLQCAEVASNVAKNLEWMSGESYVWFECNADCRNQNGTPISSVTVSGHRRKWVMSKWWGDYMIQVAVSLAEKPSGTTVTDSNLIDKALMKASQCAFCRGRAFREMRDFASVFLTEVDKSTDQVILEVKI